MKHIRVLSLDGGGIRALITLQALKYLSRQANRPIHELFDFVAGSSTGAIQALGLTSPRMLSPLDLEQLYLRHASEIFDSRLLAIGGLVGPKYRVAGLEHCLQTTLGGYTLADCRVPTLAMAYDLQARLPVMLSSYGVNKNMACWQAARASSAGPTFFEPYHNLVDGGCVNNNPALTAAIEAAKLYGCAVADCDVLSLGCGAGEQPIPARDAAGWGALGWIQPLISVFTDGVADLTHLQMSELLPPEQYLRLQMRLDGAPGTASPDMDCITPANMLALQQAGTQLVGANIAKLDAFIARL